MKPVCALCHRRLNVPHVAVVEVTANGEQVRKATLQQLHAYCAEDWSRAELERLRAFYDHEPHLVFNRRVEIMPGD